MLRCLPFLLLHKQNAYIKDRFLREVRHIMDALKLKGLFIGKTRYLKSI